MDLVKGIPQRISTSGKNYLTGWPVWMKNLKAGSEIEEIEIEDDSFSSFVVGKKVKVLIQDMDTIRWK